jgi:hypothetical protein
MPRFGRKNPTIRPNGICARCIIPVGRRLCRASPPEVPVCPPTDKLTPFGSRCRPVRPRFDHLLTPRRTAPAVNPRHHRNADLVEDHCLACDAVHSSSAMPEWLPRPPFMANSAHRNVTHPGQTHLPPARSSLPLGLPGQPRNPVLSLSGRGPAPRGLSPALPGL